MFYLEKFERYSTGQMTTSIQYKEAVLPSCTLNTSSANPHTWSNHHVCLSQFSTLIPQTGTYPILSRNFTLAALKMYEFPRCSREIFPAGYLTLRDLCIWAETIFPVLPSRLCTHKHVPELTNMIAYFFIHSMTVLSLRARGGTRAQNMGLGTRPFVETSWCSWNFLN